MPTQTTLSRVESFPFDSRFDGYDAEGYPVYDRAVGASLLRATFAKFFSDGVFPTPANALQISKGSGLTVNIQPGIFIINGAMGGYFTDAQTITLDTAAPQGNVAYGVMLRYDETEQYRSCYIRVVRGDAAGNPTPPAPDQSTPGVKEYRLGCVTVPSGSTDLSNATVTNEKGLAVCPYAAPFEEIDMSEVTEDARTSANEALTKLLAYFEEYRDMVDAAVDDTLAGQLQTQITELQQQLDDFEVDFESEVDDFSIEYASDNYPTDPKRLRVKDGGIVRDSLSQWLQIELGIADTDSWTYDDFKSMAQASSGDETLQTSLMGYLDSTIVTGWTDGQIAEFAGLLVESCQATFVGYITNSRAQQMSPTSFSTLYNEVSSTVQATLRGKINLLSYSWGDMHAMHALLGDSWASQSVGQTKGVVIGSKTYQARLIGVGHDDATDSLGSTLTFQTTKSISESGYYNLADAARSTDTSYANTQICNVTMPGLYNIFSNDIKPHIREVTKPCSWTNNNVEGGNTVDARVWPMSLVELYGMDNPCASANWDRKKDGSQYQYWSENPVTSSTSVLWPSSGENSAITVSMRTGPSLVAASQSYYHHTYYRIQLGTSGSCGISTVNTNDNIDLVPCFCI